MYVILGGGGLLASYLSMTSLGFEARSIGGVRYWVNRQAVKSDLPPVLFIHGIGIGLVMYRPILQVWPFAPQPIYICLLAAFMHVGAGSDCCGGSHSELQPAEPHRAYL